MKFVDFAKKWLEKRQNEVKPVSITTYKRLIHTYINPFLGEYEVKKINQETLKEFEEYLDSLDLTETTKGNIKRLLKSILFPKKNTSQQGKREESIKIEEYLNNEELHRLIDYLKSDNTKTNTLILLSILSGIGLGELCAIKGNHIDFQNNTIEIMSVISRSLTSPYEVKKTTLVETDSTHQRKIILPEWFMQGYLKQITPANTFFIATSSKIPGDPRTMQYYMQKLSKKLDMHINFKVLQATFIRNCLKKGANLGEIAEFIGSTPKNLEKRGYHEAKTSSILEFQESLNLITKRE